MIATIAGICIALFIAAAVFIRFNGRWSVPGAVGRALRWLAIAATAGIAVALLPSTLADSGAATVYLLGVPLLAAGAAAVADLTGRAVTVVTAVAAVLMLAWGLLLGLGSGVWFVLPALVLGLAALASLRPHDRVTPSPS
ncbi:MAG TPA: hypothetical protein VFG15_10865 [Amycolatopsis sp.]|nr:hypothetical protein [Amycolatopsis sp.]